MLISDQKFPKNIRTLFKFVTITIGFFTPLLLRNSPYLKITLFAFIILFSLFTTGKKYPLKTTRLIPETYTIYFVLGVVLATCGFVLNALLF